MSMLNSFYHVAPRLFALSIFILASAPSLAKSSNEAKMNLIVASKRFAITLADNEAARAFRQMLPLVIKMEDLNANEKHALLSKTLPSKSSNPKHINAGDIMLYGSKTLVIFYKSFATQYAYTKLGQIDDPSQLESALGSGDVAVSFQKNGDD